MANNMNFTTAQAFLKEKYVPNKITVAVQTGRPALAIAKKMTDFAGSDMKQPILVGNPQNRSATFATALAGTSTSSVSAFTVTTVNNYSFENIDNRTIKSTKDNSGAFENALTLSMDGAINSLANSQARQFYRAGWGELGRIGVISGTKITFTDPSASRLFEKGMKIVFSSSLNGAVLRSGTSVSVVSINSNDGSIVISAATGSPQNGDYVFADGDRENSATPTRLCMSGLEAWVPYGGVATSGDLFFGVDRFSDSRLYGNWLDGTAMNVEDALLGGIEQAVAQAGKPDYALVNPSQYLNLVRTLGAKVQYVDVETDAKVGFRGVEIQGPAGVVTVLSDIYCPGDRAYIVESDNLILHSVGELQNIFDEDGTPYLRSASNDGVDLRVYSYSQLRVLAPSHFCTVALTA